MPEPGGIMGAIGAGQVDQGGTVVTGRLPDQGPIRIGSVTLPAGRLITGWHGSDHHVAWVTADPVPDSGQVWAALSELHPRRAWCRSSSTACSVGCPTMPGTPRPLCCLLRALTSAS